MKLEPWMAVPHVDFKTPDDAKRMAVILNQMGDQYRGRYERLLSALEIIANGFLEEDDAGYTGEWDKDQLSRDDMMEIADKAIRGLDTQESGC